MFEGQDVDHGHEYQAPGSKLEGAFLNDLKSSKVKYYHIMVMDDGQQFKSYIPVKAGVALLEYYVAPGKVLMRTLEIYAELPTKLGNTLVKKYSYQLSAKNIR